MQVYALKAMHKAPIVESKQIEHVLNERRTLEEANHPLCVRLCGAYQDKTCLYLLQASGAGARLGAHAGCLAGLGCMPQQAGTHSPATSHTR